MRRTLDPGRGTLLREEPGERFGHRLRQGGVRRFADPVLREDAQGRAECGTLGLVAHLAMRGLPRDERALRLGEPEDAAPVLIPRRPEVIALDRRERGLLSLVVRIEAALLVPVPAPRGALDAGLVEDTQIRRETLEVLGTWMCGRASMVCLGPPETRFG